MSKDPAFLFYSSDFLTGTMFMTNEQIGIYIRLLCAQHQHGGFIDKISFDTMVGNIAIVRSKFIECEQGYYNKRLVLETEKRSKFCESRNNNRTGKNQYKGSSSSGHMTKSCPEDDGHMDNENDNDNLNDNLFINNVTSANAEIKTYFDNKELFEQIWKRYPRPLGKKAALRHFLASVSNEELWRDVNTALDNYISFINKNQTAEKFIKYGSSWFNNWNDWLEVKTENELSKFNGFGEKL